MDPRASITIRPASWTGDRAAIEFVRRQVFVHEQGVPEHEEWDTADPTCRHVLALAAKRDAVGTGRLDATGKIGRVAVLQQWRWLDDLDMTGVYKKWLQRDPDSMGPARRELDERMTRRRRL